MPSACSSVELGMIRCMDEGREQVGRELGVSVTDAQIERVLSGKACSLDVGVQKVIDRQGDVYTRQLLSAVMEAGFDLHTLPVVMLGGGAAVVSRRVSEGKGVSRAFALEDDKVNAEGFERILEQKENQVVTVTIPDKVKPGLIIRKVDAETGAPLAGAVFTVTHSDGKLVGEYLSDANGKY